jgi:hypothetical protein
MGTSLSFAGVFDTDNNAKSTRNPVLFLIAKSIRKSANVQIWDGRYFAISAIVVAICASVGVMLVLLAFRVGDERRRLDQNQTRTALSPTSRTRSLEMRGILWAVYLGTICLLVSPFVEGVVRPAFPEYVCLSPMGSVGFFLTNIGMVLLIFASIAYAIRLGKR